MKLRKIAIFVGAVAVATIVAVVAALTLNGGSKTKINAAGTATPEQAIQKAESFAKVPGLRLEQVGLKKTPAGEYYEIADKEKGFLAWVNKASGEVNYAFFGGLEKEGAQVISEAEAKQSAISFASERQIDLGGLSLSTKLHKEGLLEGLYTFTWQKVDKGIKLPDYIQIVVNSNTGKIVSVSVLRLPDYGPFEDKVGEAAAIKKATSLVDFQPEKTETSLRVWPHQGVPVLQWEIVLHGKAKVGNEADLYILKVARVVIRADNGEVLESSSW